MPTRHEIDYEIVNAKSNIQDVIRKKYLAELEEYTGRDTIIYISAFATNIESNITDSTTMSIGNKDMQAFIAVLNKLKRDKLDLILHSPGGSINTAEQIVNYLRKKYPSDIRVIIPQAAMSAACMISCASDVIVMGKHSAIGPIDPQIPITMPNGQRIMVAAQCILNEFEQAKTDINTNPDLAAIWVNKILNIPHGTLDRCTQAIKLSKSLVKNWLEKYMLRNLSNKAILARNISDWLSDANNHFDHGRPIPLDVARDKGIVVSELEDDQVFQDKVLSVFHSCIATIEFSNLSKIIENQHGVGYYYRLE